MIKFVTCCEDCPLNSIDFNYGPYCGHPKLDGPDITNMTTTLSICPLRNNHLIIKFDNTKETK